MKATTTYPAIVGGIIAASRRRQKINQTDLSKELTMKQSSYSKIERGLTPITIDHLVICASALGTTPGQILEQADRIAEHAAEIGILIVSRDVTSITMISPCSLRALIN